MSENPFKISVIVPVYNVEKYLSRCIDSILSQTFTDFELLLVDDGSTDKSGEICDEYAKTDARIKVFHTENRGVSAARNLGIKEASADWICFVDSDDWVEKKFLSDLYGDGFSQDECIIFQRAFVEYESSPEKNRISFPYYIDMTLYAPFDGKQIIKYKILDDVFIWAKIFNKNIITTHGIWFCENLSIGEDVAFVHTYLQYVKEIRLQSSYSYHYMKRNIITLVNTFHSSEEWIQAHKVLMAANIAICDNLSVKGTEYVKKICTTNGLYQLYFACINVNENNYHSIFRYVRSKKTLFDEYFYPLNFKQRMFKLFFFAKWMPYRLIFFLVKQYIRFFKT